MPDPEQYYDHFGQVLRAARVGIVPRRVRRKGEDPELPGNSRHVPALELIGCMKKRGGYSISSGAYSEIESGISAPKDSKGFVDAVVKCAELEHDELGRDLRKQLAFDQLAKKWGVEDAAQFMPDRPVRRSPFIPRPIR